MRRGYTPFATEPMISVHARYIKLFNIFTHRKFNTGADSDSELPDAGGCFGVTWCFLVVSELPDAGASSAGGWEVESLVCWFTKFADVAWLGVTGVLLAALFIGCWEATELQGSSDVGSAGLPDTAAFSAVSDAVGSWFLTSKIRIISRRSNLLILISAY